MKVQRLSRRTFLRGAGGVALGLPLLELMHARRASANAGAPKRLVVWFTPNGNMSCCGGDHWTPTGSETSFTLSPVLQPLAPFQQKLIVLTGVAMTSAHYGPGDDHHKGMAHQLTGIEDVVDGIAGGPSIDSVLGQQIGGTTKFPEYLFGVQPFNQPMFYDASGHAIQPQGSPQTAFSDLFTGVMGGPSPAQAALIAQRQSVIDLVKADLDLLRPRLGSSDQTLLDSHITAIRQIEQQLTQGGTTGASCAAPQLQPASDYLSQGKSMMDLLAMSLACDLTRVAGIQWSGMTSDIVFSQLGATQGHHALSHQLDQASSVATLVQINQMYMQQLAYLLQKLDSIPEGAGTLLDNTVVLVTNELTTGNHDHDNMPYLLAGSCGGTFRMGRWVQSSGHSHNDLLVSLLNAMGVNATTFGNPAYCRGPLPGLT